MLSLIIDAMSTSAANTKPEPYSETRKAAFINLLTDEDPAVYQLVREKILACGREAIDWLRPHTLSSDPVLRRRSQEIIHHFARRNADDRFLAFCLTESEELNVEQGA